MTSDAKRQEAFGFTAEDLSENRAGRLSATQQTRLEAYRRIHGKGARAAVVVFGALALAFLAFSLFATQPGMDQARPVLLGFSGGIVLIFIGVWVNARLHGRALANGTISVLEGPVSVWSKEIRTPEHKLGTGYFYKIRRRTFQFEAPEQMAALVSGQAYRLYVIRNGRVPIILSVEPLNG
ncbi:hypothetical protein E2K80_15110 [Rhodophyticola sp. CCM32]|uniref:hypothetical protein n=1 Tax=Rhodophyticola sp. CCM32 TaxID=2916397 RepID=UPI00107F9A03|nr:hypothetical protein [Rhodophyticola sp. CCM32]QBY01892.1 hypothetical protein E2K80_15110 [Rhodophyticola sp. CCM32]